MAATEATHHRTAMLPEDMGEIRTIMGADRTLMAWIRTALSMLSFGFTIYKFLEAIAAEDKMNHPDSPRQVGLFLAAVGIACIVLGTIDYWVTLRDLAKVEKFRLGRPVLLLALIMSVAGLALFISIAFKLI
jgi:putative membrane protein